MRKKLLGVFLLAFLLAAQLAADDGPLPGTKPLTLEGDIAAQMVAGVDRFLLKELAKSPANRERYWKPHFTSVEAFNKAVKPNRRELAKLLGVVEPRVPFKQPQIVSRVGESAVLAKSKSFTVHAVRWPVLAFPGPTWPKEVSVHGEGLLLTPTGREPLADVVALPDADQTPEQLAGLAEGIPPASQFARRLAESGCRVLVPVLISREYKARNGRAKMTNREYVYRSAFELGRHPIGYEVQKVLAAVDWFAAEADDKRESNIAVLGYGEGGQIALLAAALDERIDSVGVSGFLDQRMVISTQPVDRNLFGLLNRFGDAELAAMIVPRQVIFNCGSYPEIEFPSEGGAPGRLAAPDVDLGAAELEWQTAKNYVVELPLDYRRAIAPVGSGREAFDAVQLDWTLSLFTKQRDNIARPGDPPVLISKVDPDTRQQCQLGELDRHNQWLLRESPYVRKERFWDKLDYSSVDSFQKSVEPFRQEFRDDVIGRFDIKPLPFNARTRKIYDKEKWVGYEVMLDVFPDVFAYGILCLPKDLPTDGSEQRPVVVCQHGLEGRPSDCIVGDHPAYHDFAARLCERGFVTFCPQNLYIGRDKFRTLQRKANPLGKTLFSIITPQHQQICDWLQTLPYVDGERIGFYGLSYGGKTAMRVPPLVDDYKCVICSADFNDWVWKCASTRSRYSYVWTGEYEIFEWNLAHTFNYAEMAALVAPRPFMVERGHFDGVAPDERVAAEFAKVRHLYQAKLKLPADHCQIEWFAGPHTINGQGTFKFLHQHLNWPEPSAD